MLKHITFSATILIASATNIQASPTTVAYKCLSKPICSTAISVGLERLYDAMEPHILDSFRLMYRTFDLRQSPTALLAYLDMIEKRLKKEGKLTAQIKSELRRLRKLINNQTNK